MPHRQRQDRRDDRQADRGPGQQAGSSTQAGGGPVRYQVRQGMFTIGDDFWIETESGQKVFKVDGKAMRVRSTLLFEDAQGRELYAIQEKMARARDTMNIDDAAGKTVLKVHNAMLTPARDRWQIDVPGGKDLSRQAILCSTSIRLSVGVTKSPKSPRNGSTCAICMVSKSPINKTRPLLC